MSDDAQLIRMVEALLFAAAEPLDEASIAARLPEGTDVKAVLASLAEHYAERGIALQQVAGGWAFRTAPDLAFLMEREKTVQKRLSRAAVETLAIIAYHQPITRAEIEEVRGVSLSKGTLDVLLEAGWIRLRGRKQSPGRPLTYGTTQEFLDHFGLADVKDLPGLEELKAAGLLSAEPPEEMVREAEQQAAASRGEKPDDEDGEGDEETFDPDAAPAAAAVAAADDSDTDDADTDDEDGDEGEAPDEGMAAEDEDTGEAALAEAGDSVEAIAEAVEDEADAPAVEIAAADDEPEEPVADPDEETDEQILANSGALDEPEEDDDGEEDDFRPAGSDAPYGDVIRVSAKGADEG
jgi:segregation and condensation protein B